MFPRSTTFVKYNHPYGKPRVYQLCSKSLLKGMCTLSMIRVLLLQWWVIRCLLPGKHRLNLLYLIGLGKSLSLWSYSSISSDPIEQNSLGGLPCRQMAQGRRSTYFKSYVRCWRVTLLHKRISAAQERKLCHSCTMAGGSRWNCLCRHIFCRFQCPGEVLSFKKDICNINSAFRLLPV